MASEDAAPLLRPPEQTLDLVEALVFLPIALPGIGILSGLVRGNDRVDSRLHDRIACFIASARPADRLWSRFPSFAGCLGTDLDGGVVREEKLHLEGDRAPVAELVECRLKRPVLHHWPHRDMDGIPLPEPIGQASSLATILRNMQYGIERMPVGTADISALRRGEHGKRGENRFGDFLVQSRHGIGSPASTGPDIQEVRCPDDVGRERCAPP